MIIPIILLVLSLVLTGVAYFARASAGRRWMRGMLPPVVMAVLAVSMLLPSGSGMRTALAAIVVLLAIMSLVTNSDVVRRSRVELSLLGAAAMALAASYFLTNIPSGMQVALMVLVLPLMMASIAVMILQALRAYRTYRASQPR